MSEWKELGTLASVMLANYCVLSDEEVIPFPVRVAAQGEPVYRGEYYFVDEGNPEVEGGGRVQLIA